MSNNKNWSHNVVATTKILGSGIRIIPHISKTLKENVCIQRVAVSFRFDSLIVFFRLINHQPSTITPVSKKIMLLVTWLCHKKKIWKNISSIHARLFNILVSGESVCVPFHINQILLSSPTPYETFWYEESMGSWQVVNISSIDLCRGIRNYGRLPLYRRNCTV